MGKFEVQDHYFRLAKKMGLVARSYFKLEEIDQKFHLFHNVERVLDLGHFPGSWIQYCQKKHPQLKNIIGIDIQGPSSRLVADHPRTTLFEESIENLSPEHPVVKHGPFGLVLSDMAPSTCGIKSVDQLKSLELVEMVFSRLPLLLKRDGSVVIKLFEGHDLQSYIKQQKKVFEKWTLYKPKSTRKISKEIYGIGTNYQG